MCGWATVLVMSAFLGASVGCTDEDAAEQAASGAAGEAGERAAGGSGGKADAGGAGAGGAGGAGVGGEATCDCRRDDNSAHVPLECACAAWGCTTLAEDASTLPDQLGWPYYLLLGTCEGGYRQLTYGEAEENSGERTYDATGRLVYRSEGPYSVGVPDACGFEEPFGFGNLVIGEDPATGCERCLLAGERTRPGGVGGEGGTGSGDELPYPQLATSPCSAEVIEALGRSGD